MNVLDLRPGQHFLFLGLVHRARRVEQTSQHAVIYVEESSYPVLAELDATVEIVPDPKRATISDFQTSRSTDGVLTSSYLLSDGSAWLVVRSVDPLTGRQQVRVKRNGARASLKAFQALTGVRP